MVKRQKMSVNKMVEAAKSTSAEYSWANIAAAPPVGIPKRTAKIIDVICPHLNTKNAIIYIIIGIIISLVTATKISANIFPDFLCILILTSPN